GGDQVVLAEGEGRQEGAVDEVAAQAPRHRGLEGRERTLVHIVGGLVFRERAAAVLDVKAGLLAGVQALDQLLQRGLAGDDDEFFESGHRAMGPSGANDGESADGGWQSAGVAPSPRPSSAGY